MGKDSEESLGARTWIFFTWANDQNPGDLLLCWGWNTTQLFEDSIRHYKEDISIKLSLDGDFNCFLFSSLLGEDSHFDEHMFQGGWFNHQLVTRSVNGICFFWVISYEEFDPDR